MENKKCPMCAEQIPLAAVTCEYCGAQFEVTSTGYCQTCHDVREVDGNGQCKVCGNAVVDLRMESRLIEEPARELLPASQSLAQTEITKTGKSRLPIGILAGILILVVIGAVLWFRRNSIPAVSSLFATSTPTATATFTSTITNTSTSSPTATFTLTPTITPTTAPPYDDFKGKVLDSKKWVIVLDHADKVYRSSSVSQDERLTISVGNTKPDSSTYVQSIWGFTGDFDIQIDFQIGAGWARPSTGHLDSAVLGVIIENNQYHITQVRRSRSEGTPENIFMAWADKDDSPYLAISSVASSGKYRLIRTGTYLEFLYDIGTGWKKVGIMTAPIGLAKIYFGIASVYASHSFTTYFDNFVINLGNPTFK